MAGIQRHNVDLTDRPAATLGQRLSGNFLAFFAGALILAACLAYLISFVMFFLSFAEGTKYDRDQIYMIWIACIVGGSLLQILGHLMGMFGQYLMGSITCKTREEIRIHATLGLTADLSMVWAILFVVCFLASLGQNNHMFSVVLIVVAILSSFVSVKCGRKLSRKN